MASKNFLSTEFTPKFTGYYEFEVEFDLDTPLSMAGKLEILKH
ncbi:hypothetical protein [Crocinitomix algicola]|nr:hypothetical protein [Crocinitomix algicola]